MENKTEEKRRHDRELMIFSIKRSLNDLNKADKDKKGLKTIKKIYNNSVIKLNKLQNSLIKSYGK